MHGLLPGFTHVPGRHCGSTALMNAMRYWGVPLSEAMCFGLGAGTGFRYLEAPGAQVPRVFFPRNGTLEPTMFESLGLPFEWRTTDDPDEAWRLAKAGLDAGMPVLAKCDLFYLAYYKSSTHFSGHMVLLVGYDEEAGDAFLSDTSFPEVQREPLAQLSRARCAKGEPMDVHNDHYPVPKPEGMRPLAEAIPYALGLNARWMLDETRGDGLHMMPRCAERMPTWADEAEDVWRWCARFGYQIIERRGTGGAAFRRLLEQFLAEGAAHVPALREARFTEPLGDAREAWHALAEVLREASETGDRALLAKGAGLMREIHAHEERFWTTVADAFPAD